MPRLMWPGLKKLITDKYNENRLFKIKSEFGGITFEHPVVNGGKK